jgi:hypothetical protein
MRSFYRRATIGASSLAKWMFGVFTPVSKEQAQARADVCNSPCPKNQSEGLFDDLVGAAADMARQAAGLRARMKLEVSKGQKDLKMCAACGCDLKLKVWQDIRKILQDTSEYEYSELWSNCWIRKEKEQDGFPTKKTNVLDETG